ncbi:MAG: GNAT family N-acetyltransferase [Erysipelotrichaceae bacterium]
MNKTISYRPIKRSDYDKLEDIIIETWNYDKFGNKKTAKALARVFLSSCLANQNFTSVALINNEPVGVIMGKSEKKHPILLYYHLHQFISIIKMISFQEGRKVLKMFEGFEKINKELSKQCTIKFDGEIAFFVVSKKQRGTGIGKELFRQVKEYMKSEFIDCYYLYTDSSCNYGFYEHQGLIRFQEKKLQLPAFKNKEMSFFLYGVD